MLSVNLFTFKIGQSVESMTNDVIPKEVAINPHSGLFHSETRDNVISTPTPQEEAEACHIISIHIRHLKVT